MSLRETNSNNYIHSSLRKYWGSYVPDTQSNNEHFYTALNFFSFSSMWSHSVILTSLWSRNYCYSYCILRDEKIQSQKCLIIGQGHMAFECRSKTQIHGQNDFSQCKMGDPWFKLKLIKFSLGKYWEVFLEHSYVLGMVTFHTSLAVGLIII